MKKVLFTVAILALAHNVFGQDLLAGALSPIEQTINNNFGKIIGLIFLVCAAFNSPKLMEGQRDVKGFFSNVLVFGGGVSLLVTAYAWISGMSL